ncbi:MAG: radical SAM protein, partial [Acidobacteria bacterium]|nr:radical SAM protein [Acidobacteriota bacterium]
DNLESVAGIVYKTKDGDVIETTPRPMLENLSLSPTPAYELINLTAYNKPGLLPPPIEAQRGCSFSCKFCGVHYPNWGKQVRFKDIKKLVDEIQLLHQYGFDSFFFTDETITLNRHYLADICHEMIARNLHTRMRWTGYTRADTIDKEIAELMVQAGCYCVALGVETGSQEELDSINKKANITDYKKGIKIIKDAGMDVHTLIIFGFPEVGHEDIALTARFLEETKPTLSQFFIFHPVPGTDFFANPDKHGLHYSVDTLEDWYKFDFIEAPLSDTKKLTREEIIKYFIMYNFAFRSYESIPGDIDLQKRLLRNALPRKRKEVVMMRTGKKCLYSSPFLPPGMVYADMHKNCRQLNELQYEVLLRCNGDFTIEEIAEKIAGYFNFSPENALTYVINLLFKFQELKIIHELDALAGYSSLIRQMEPASSI